MAPAATAAPRQSMRSARRSERGTCQTIITTAAIAMGTLIQKIDRHVHWVR